MKYYSIDDMNVDFQPHHKNWAKREDVEALERNLCRMTGDADYHFKGKKKLQARLDRAMEMNDHTRCPPTRDSDCITAKNSRYTRYGTCEKCREKYIMEGK